MRKLILGLGIVFFAGVAYAADQPQYGPPADWVKPAGPLNIQAPDTTTPARILLEDTQVKFSVDGRAYYSEIAAKIQASQGLAVFGNITLNWRPDTDMLTIHKLRLIRGEQTIDLLAGDHKFTVLRRENNLERAMLDGTLTAAIQPEGLQVGDIVDLSYTLQRNDPVMQGRSETFTGNVVAQPVDHLNFREIWPKSKTLQWRQTDGLSPAKIMTTRDGNELTIEMTNTQPPKYPKGAPARYFRLGQIETSEFKSWAEVSALMAPLYKKAAVLGTDSPLKAEVAKIKAASADPKIQAMAALKLVEDQIRYLFLGMNNGGYIPADADQTWTRRFGDCKGKTALLVALLHELGIEAQPALASVANGDGLDERLPMLELFDHILVRAVIGGKTYWLDGTRMGDRNLDDLPMPMFHWLLPVQEARAKIEKVIIPIPSEPLTETQLDIDASAGVDMPAPAHARTIMRGDLAILTKLQLGNVQKSDLERNLREYWKKQYDWIDISSVDASYDDGTGEEHLSMDGSAKIEWKPVQGASAKQHQPAASTLGWKVDFDREAGSKLDAPYSVAFPYFMKTIETVRLPYGGDGFTITGTDIDKIIEVHAFKRITRIQNGIFSMEATTKALAPEFPAAAAPSAKHDLRDLVDMAVYLRFQKPAIASPKNVDKAFQYNNSQ